MSLLAWRAERDSQTTSTRYCRSSTCKDTHTHTHVEVRVTEGPEWMEARKGRASHLQQEGDLGLPVESLLVGSQPPQYLLIAKEDLPGPCYVVEVDTVAAPAPWTGTGGQAEVGGKQVARAGATEERAVLQLRGVLGDMEAGFKIMGGMCHAFYSERVCRFTTVLPSAAWPPQG